MASLLAGKRLALAATTARVGVGATVGASQLQQRTFFSVAEKYYEAYKRFGWKLTLWKLYNPGDIKFGYKVGEDQFGNEYFEDPNELTYMNRYTEYHVQSFDDFEASQIPPEWHVWMQHTSDAKPTDPGQDVRIAS
jgi:hypothetical protein